MAEFSGAGLTEARFGVAVRAYWTMAVAQIRGQAQYRVSFLLDTLFSSLVSLAEIATLLVIFRVTPSLGGFGVREVFLVSTLCEVGFQACELTVGNVERLGRYVRTGQLDVLLARPLGVLGQLLVSEVAPRRIGRLVQAVVLYVVALCVADVHWTVARAVLAVVAPTASAALFGAVFTAGSCVAFWWVDSGEFANAFTYGGRQFASYPATVYPVGLRALFAYGLGLAFTAYQPGLALLGRPDPLGLPPYAAWATPLVAAIAWVGALLLWRAGVRHYRSTGS